MTKVEWSVSIFDKPGADRTSVRPTHVASIPATVNDGTVTAVGALYHDKEKTKFAGSTFHMMAELKDEIVAFLKRDIYYESGVWDIESVVAFPVGIACRLAKPMAGVNVE